MLKMFINIFFIVYYSHTSRISKSQWSWSIMSQIWKSNVQKQRMARAYSQIANEYKYITTPIFYVNDGK